MLSRTAKTLAVAVGAIMAAGAHGGGSGGSETVSDSGGGSPVSGCGSLTGHQTHMARTIWAVSEREGIPERGRVVAYATAIQESGLRNLDHGDRDSLGLFQQRPSQGWGSPSEVTDPAHATRSFYQALTDVDGWHTLPVTDAAQAVQRSAHPHAYADHAEAAEAIAAADGCT